MRGRARCTFLHVRSCRVHRVALPIGRCLVFLPVPALVVGLAVDFVEHDVLPFELVEVLGDDIGSDLVVEGPDRALQETWVSDPATGRIGLAPEPRERDPGVAGAAGEAARPEELGLDRPNPRHQDCPFAAKYIRPLSHFGRGECLWATGLFVWTGRPVLWATVRILWTVRRVTSRERVTVISAIGGSMVAEVARSGRLGQSQRQSQCAVCQVALCGLRSHRGPNPHGQSRLMARP